jgi:UDP-3-O-[3-hydroxymyristoyl] glucosamine N-acyltransferase
MKAFSISLGELANQFQLTLVGDPTHLVTGISTLEKATPNDISFFAHDKYGEALKNTQSGAVIITPEQADLCPTNALITPNPKWALMQLLQHFSSPKAFQAGIHPTALIHEEANIDPSASIAPYVVIGKSQIGPDVVIEAHCVIGNDCVIGRKTHLKPRVTLYDDVIIGEQGLIHSGVVLGADGFGFVQGNNGWEKIPQIGGLRIGNRVDIGANTTIDRGALAPTTIGHGVILDNLIQVGHNVDIGDQTAIAACTAIGGSTKIGKRCMIGGCSLISGHIQIADDVHLAGGTGVANHIKEKGVYASGLSARPYEQWRRNLARFHHLDELWKRVKKLEKESTEKTKVG